MARPLRIEYEGALYHVTSRGNTRERIFWEDADRVIFPAGAGLKPGLENYYFKNFNKLRNHIKPEGDWSMVRKVVVPV